MNGDLPEVSTDDLALPSLPQVLDPDRMLPFITQAAGLEPDDAGRMSCSVDVLVHKVGQRCTVRYTLVRRADPAGSPPVFAAVGKLYRRRRRAERMYRRMEALSGRTFAGMGGPCIPAPLLLVPELRLVLQECVQADDVRHALAAGEGERPLALAARWLAGLHSASPVPDLKVMSLDHELDKVDGWCGRLAPELSPSDTPVLDRTREALHRLAGGISSYAPAMIHKDIYYAHVLWNGQRVWVVDFDQLQTGDPALDIGHFLAHLENLAYRTTGRADAYATEGKVFLTSYPAGAAETRERLPFYKAYTFLKLAATEVMRRQGEWGQLAAVLTQLAWREVGGGGPEGWR
jgi:aminoglycoside phosphotransferase (APT) family kinase protein